MTKEDILNMKTSAEINHTIFTNPELWDEEIDEYSIKVAKREQIEMYGSEYFFPHRSSEKMANRKLLNVV